MAEEPRPFYIGLNMPGAVSAGAYTAGVLDFLIDALDSLYAERELQKAKYGTDYAKWEIPPHEVRIVAMAGASAGGICSAIAAACFCEDFTPVRGLNPTSAPNRLYKAWVEDIDAQYLLGSRDLQDKSAPVVSILDSTQIDDIAKTAIPVTRPRPAKRPYVADPLKLVLTVTNLGGIPYGIDGLAGTGETKTLYHSDQTGFELRWDGEKPEGEALPLNPFTADNWDMLADAAKATSAFPIALASRYLKRTATVYNKRQWEISSANPKADAGKCDCSYFTNLQPSWDLENGYQLKTLNVDGGVTNNDPFECAHQTLCEQEPVQPAGRSPRSAEEADRAVISVAPFLTTPLFSPDPPKQDLKTLLGVLVGAVINQARIQGENIKLTQDPTVFSRWAISPSTGDQPKDALASSCLGAFGGFIAREFRDHDYQLGRRNCQWFLKKHFGLPLDNVVLRQYAISDEAKNRFGMQMPGNSAGVCLIPLVGELDPNIKPIREVDVKIDPERLYDLADAATGRLKLVASRLLGVDGLVKSAGFDVLWALAQGKIKQALLKKLGTDLARQNLLA
jgi:hypothetical protein